MGMGLPFGVIIGVSKYLLEGSHGVIFHGIISGVYFGIIASLITVFMHKRAVRKISPNNSPEVFETHHYRTIKLPLPYETVFASCADVAETLGSFSVVRKDLSQGIVVAESGFSKNSWGNIIRFELSEIDKSETMVKIYSKPKQRWTLVDYGENLKNIERLTKALNFYKGKYA